MKLNGERGNFLFFKSYYHSYSYLCIDTNRIDISPQVRSDNQLVDEGDKTTPKDQFVDDDAGMEGLTSVDLTIWQEDHLMKLRIKAPQLRKQHITS